MFFGWDVTARDFEIDVNHLEIGGGGSARRIQRGTLRFEVPEAVRATFETKLRGGVLSIMGAH
jgi:hypothetical protein